MTGPSNHPTEQFPRVPHSQVERAAQGIKGSGTIDMKSLPEDDFFNKAPILTSIASGEGFLVEVGESWEALTGWSAAELTSVPFFDFIHPDDVESTGLELALLNSGEETAGFRNRYRKIDGNYVPLQWHARKAEDGNIYAVAWDATDLVNAETAILKEQLVLKAITEFLANSVSNTELTKSLTPALEVVAAVTGATGVGVMTCQLDESGRPTLVGVQNLRAPDLIDAGEIAGNTFPALLPKDQGSQPITAMSAVSTASKMTEPFLGAFHSQLEGTTAGHILAIPICSNEPSTNNSYSLGVLAALKPDMPFTPPDIYLLRPLANAIGVAIVANSDKKALEQAVLDLERLSSILTGAAETSDSPLLVFDNEENLMTMNSSAIKLFGSARAADNGWGAHSLFLLNGLPAPTLAQTFLRKTLPDNKTDTEDIVVEWSVVTNSGAVIPVSIVGSAMAGQFGDTTGWVLRCTPLISDEAKTHEAISSERLAGQINLLETRQGVMSGLAQAATYVAASTSQREALQVIEQFLPDAFPFGEAQLLHITRAERSHSVPTPELMIGSADCWSLRTGHCFQSGESNRISCAHLPIDAHAICVPLTDGLDQVAVITLDLNTTKIALPDFAIKSLLEEVSNSFSISLANLRLRRSLEEQAYLDPLTQVGNRRVAEDSIATGIARLRSLGEEFAIVMVDIDHFKVVNDRFGHEAGDRVLAEFAGHLRAHLREKDSVARLGGEEFLLILQDVTRLEVEQIVEELVKRIDTAAFYENITVTASMGAVHIATGECTSDELLRHADSLLYEAKRQGRNQFQIGEFGGIRPSDGSGRVTETEHWA